MAPKIHSAGLPGGQVRKKTVLMASRTPQGPLLGGHLGVENHSKTRPGSVSKTHVTSNSVLERFWITLETDFKGNFEVSA